MFCKNCGKEIEENVKFCSSCGTAVENNTPADTTAQPSTASPAEGLLIEHETVQEKKWATPEKILSALSLFFLFVTVISPIITAIGTGIQVTNIFEILRGVLITGAFFGVAMFIHNKRPLTDHYKFKCPYCNEENTVSADETKTFNCSKCKKTMTIINGQIKTIN